MNTSRLLITGAAGFIGGNLFSHFTSESYDTYGLDINTTISSPIYNERLTQCDVSKPAELAATLLRLKPSVIIHCAAIKNLPACEDDKIQAFAVNTLSTESICDYAKHSGAKVVYLSSDVVFDGKVGNYFPGDKLNPINWYGKTKAFSETILASLPNAAICRTALVIGSLNKEYSKLLASELDQPLLVNQTLLPQYIYRRLGRGLAVHLPTSIISNPTPVELLCEIVEAVIKSDASGVFHTTGPDAIARYDTGLLVAKLFGFDQSLVVADDANISPLRPRNISMNTDDSFRQLGIDPKKWSLAEYLSRQELYV